MSCPNCTCDNIYRLHPGCGLNQCTECGTTWFNGQKYKAHVPRRSQPAEVLPLPDAEGRWLYRHGNDWYLWYVYLIRGELCVGGEPCVRGEYFKFVAPILPPQRDEDAEWLKDYAARHAKGELNLMRLLSIVDRLEKGQAQP